VGRDREKEVSLYSLVSCLAGGEEKIRELKKKGSPTWRSACLDRRGRSGSRDEIKSPKHLPCHNGGGGEDWKKPEKKRRRSRPVFFLIAEPGKKGEVFLLSKRGGGKKGGFSASPFGKSESSEKGKKSFSLPISTRTKTHSSSRKEKKLFFSGPGKGL